jgi:hypothetical protein
MGFSRAGIADENNRFGPFQITAGGELVQRGCRELRTGAKIELVQRF